MPDHTESISSPAAPFEPPYTYTANDGYGQTEAMPVELSTRPDTLSISKLQLSDYSDYDYSDDDFGDGLDNDDWEGASGDLTKSFNRQQHQSTNGGVALAGTNQQKPSANTFHRIDDQFKALSKHAGKIRLDDVKQDEDRLKEKADRATVDMVLDQSTRLVLMKMINNGFVSEVHGAISAGKEANVYGAVNADKETGVTSHRAVKVYNTAILVFKDRERYIKGEHRFRGGYNKGNCRNMIKIWAEKEFRNLRRIHAAGVPCPEPFAVKRNVLVMGLLGDSRGWPYPRLRDAVSGGDAAADDLCRRLYVRLLGLMRKLYRVCRLVHADLSEYNVLYHDGQLYIIDVSQSVEPDHPRALSFLRMDIKNVGDFFRRQGVATLPDREIFHFIISTEGPVEEPATTEAIERLYEADLAAAAADDDEQTLPTDVDTEVFRNQYIPQTLEQVCDVEKDTARVHMGQGKDLVYSNLLAAAPSRDGAESTDGTSDVSGEGTALGGDDDGDEGDGDSGVDQSIFEKGRPRGRRFQDKDEKKLHKQAVKEANREKRQVKLPKYTKQKLVLRTARHKKN